MGTNGRKSFPNEALEAAKQRLDGLPDTPPRRRSHRTAGEAVQELRARIRKRKRQGYTDDQIAEELKAAGLPIGTSTLKFYLRSKKRAAAVKHESSKESGAVKANVPESVAEDAGAASEQPRDVAPEKKGR